MGKDGRWERMGDGKGWEMGKNQIYQCLVWYLLSPLHGLLQLKQRSPNSCVVGQRYHEGGEMEGRETGEGERKGPHLLPCSLSHSRPALSSRSACDLQMVSHSENTQSARRRRGKRRGMRRRKRRRKIEERGGGRGGERGGWGGKGGG